MLTGQGEGRSPMVEVRLFPGSLLMAALALRTFLVCMLVVLAMAANAPGLELVAEGSVQVTRLAGNRGVAPEKGVMGVARMIESRRLPGRFPVAGLTTRAQAAAMDVGLGVAAITVCGCLFYV